jgi:acyl-CoA synthetase (NDP forming)
MSSSDLRAALDPKSIAIIGASENPNKIGGRPLLYLSRFGFKGGVYPINPKRPEVQGFRTFPSLAALPEPPEMALVVLAGDGAVAAVDECAAAGVKVCVVMASGFGETGTPEGKATERGMVERARAKGMRIVGPNCQGLANFGTGAVANFSTMFIEEPPQDGPIAIVGQSGAMSVVPYGLLRRAGLGVRHAHATGNDSDVTVCELAAAVAEDPGVELLLLYLESIPDPHNLAEVARRARARDLPVIALKSGRTAAGQAAARSHTGALANEDRVVDAFLEREGIFRARDVGQLVGAAELYLKGWHPRGRNLVAISNSGATCVLAADAASAAGLSLPKLSDDVRAELGKILPGFATTTNPVDITAALLSNSNLFGAILPAIGRDPAADAFLIGVPVAGAGYDVDAFTRDSAAFAKATGKPLVVAAPQESVAARFRQDGLSVFRLESEAVEALAQLIQHRELMDRTARLRQGEAPRVPLAPPAGTPQPLNEAESLAVLEAAGVPVVPHAVCRSADEAVAAWRRLGGPVALKGVSAAVVHKSELGIVRLDLDHEEEIRTAFREIEAVLTREGHAIEGVLVAQMRKGRREMILGAHRDPVFGPIVVVGDGGKYVEALPDLQVLLPPFPAEEAAGALRRLRIAPLFPGVRGEKPIDVASVASAAAAVAALMLRDPTIASLDVNPLLVGSEGEGCVALDAVVFRYR